MFNFLQVERYIAKKCIQLPEDFSNITCEVISNNYGPMLPQMNKHFWKSLPNDVMCDAVCMDSFKEVDLPSYVVGAHFFCHFLAHLSQAQDELL